MGSALDITQILRILPQRAPFVMLDKVTELHPRTSARAIKCVTYNEPVFAGHIPENPIFPSVLILEAMSQLTAILTYASEADPSPQKKLYTVGIEQAKFKRPVVPGDQLEIDVTVEQHRSNIWKMSAQAKVGEQLCATATILTALAAPGELALP